MFTKWTFCTRWLGGFVVAGLLVSAMTPLWNVLGGYLAVVPETAQGDAIVVLAAGLMEDGSLADESLRRAVTGFRLFKKGFAQKIVLSGPASKSGVIESAVRAKIAVGMGILPEDILQVSLVNTTRDEAQRVSELLSQSGMRKIVLVTGALHMRRSRLVFERAGFQVVAAPSDNYAAGSFQPEDRLVLMRQVLREGGALIYYKLAGYI